MTRGGLRWQRLVGLLVGLAAGAICLVLWSSSSPAAALDVPEPASAAAAEAPAGQPIRSAVERVTAPVADLPSLPAVVDQTTTSLVAPIAPLPTAVVEQVDTTLTEVQDAAVELTEPVIGPLLPALPPPDLPVLPELPILPDLGDGLDVGTIPVPGTVPGAVPTMATVDPAAPVAEPHDAATGRSAPSTMRSSSGSLVTGLPQLGPDRPTVALTSTTPGDPGGRSAPATPWPEPIAAVISLAGTAAGSTSTTALVAVLGGLTLLAMGPRWSRLCLGGPQAPGTVVHAIVSPPD